MNMKTLSEVRQTFLDFYARNGHEIVQSSPLVPHNDPTLMFTNAGMNQFKNIFTGVEQRAEKRATSSQKCVRAGGKHNDLENVGYTARHHTFFEMLGNFSFGDYFKEDAIRLTWELLTKDFGLSEEKLYITVYHTDDEAFDIWKKTTGFPDEKILRIATSDNFWAMGDTGPCGPCSEIFYDHGEAAAEGEWKVDANGNDMFGDRYIEIWNLVFMQYEKHLDGTQTDLPKPCIDTGMGLERMVAVMQGKHNNYEIDLFENLIHASKNLLGEDGDITSHRVVADHLRSACFLIADGVMPSNEGRGYVLRRIMRRAMRHLHHLGGTEALFYKLVPALIAEMGAAYPELVRAQSLIAQTLKGEEERFRETLGRGLKLLDEAKADMHGDTLDGEVAFKLYDTYGFPVDLTADILRREGKQVDEAGFDAAMAEQKNRARAAWKGSGETADEDIWFDIRDKHGVTEFTGYTCTEGQGEVVAVAEMGKNTAVVTNQTPFYAESGGQAGDVGMLNTCKVIDTQKKLGQLHVHVCEGKVDVKIGDVVDLKVNAERREKIKANHSGTHLMHAALRKILGDHVTQKGSLVEAEYLRFDFSHNEALTLEQLNEIDLEVNRMIRSNDEVGTELMTPEDAQKGGAMALFGEKYGDEVRVLSMGYSKELCGGIHVERTGDIGLFRITAESSIAAGIRRIEAITGEGAVQYGSNHSKIVSELSMDLKVKPEEIFDRINGLKEERKKLEKQISELKKKSAGDVKFDEEEVNGKKFISHKFEDLDPKDMRDMAENLRKKEAGAVIAFFGVNEGRVSILTAVGDDIKADIDAPSLARIASEATGGKGGGGRPELAQAGGADASKIDEAISAVRKAI